MKNIFLTFSLILGATPSFAKDKILLVFHTTKETPGAESLTDKSALATTAEYVLWGIDLGLRSMPKKVQDSVELIRVDIDTTLEGTVKTLGEAIKKYQPIAVIGAVTSNTAFFIKSVTEPQKVPFITPFATHPKVTEGSPLTFRMCFDDNYQAEALAKFVVKDRKLKRGVILFNKTQSYSMGFKSIFADGFEKLGGKLIESISIAGEEDITPTIIDKIKADEPDFILIPSYQFEAAAILSKLLGKLPDSMQYFGGDSWGGGRIFHKMIENSPGNFRGFYVQHWAGELKSKANLQFDALQKRYQNLIFKGTAMNAPIAIGYDTARFVLTALAAKKPGEDFTAALHKTSIEGATGPISLGKDNSPRKGLFIYEIKKNDESFFKKVEL